MGTDSFDQDTVRREVGQVTVYGGHIVFSLKDGRVKKLSESMAALR